VRAPVLWKAGHRGCVLGCPACRRGRAASRPAVVERRAWLWSSAARAEVSRAASSGGAGHGRRCGRGQASGGLRCVARRTQRDGGAAVGKMGRGQLLRLYTRAARAPSGVDGGWSRRPYSCPRGIHRRPCQGAGSGVRCVAHKARCGQGHGHGREARPSVLSSRKGAPEAVGSSPH
jgi:hypothetical protein